MASLPYQTLLMAIVQPLDRGAATEALEDGGFSPTVIQAGGGFLGREVAVLLLGLRAADEPRAIDLLRRTCHTRTEYVSVPYQGSHLPLGSPVAVEIQGATLLLLEVERCEVYP